MGSFGGFYKGEKKKPKKDKDSKNSLSARETITMPEIIEKKKKDY